MFIMHINNLPNEILEKILIEGNFFIIVNVCQRWRKIVKLNKLKFDYIFFNLTKDNSKKNKKKSNSAYLFNSRLFDKNGIPDILSENFFDNKYNFLNYEFKRYLLKNFKNFFKYISYLDTLYIIFDGLFYIYQSKKFQQYFYLKMQLKITQINK